MDIESKVKDIVSEQLCVTIDNDKSITESAKLVEDLGADSLDIVELIMALEESFDIEISEEDLIEHHIDTIASIVELVKVKLPKE